MYQLYRIQQIYFHEPSQLLCLLQLDFAHLNDWNNDLKLNNRTKLNLLNVRWLWYMEAHDTIPAATSWDISSYRLTVTGLSLTMEGCQNPRPDFWFRINNLSFIYLACHISPLCDGELIIQYSQNENASDGQLFIYSTFYSHFTQLLFNSTGKAFLFCQILIGMDNLSWRACFQAFRLNDPLTEIESYCRWI